MENAGDWRNPCEGRQGGYRSASIAGIVLSAIGILFGFLFWLFLIPVMTMGTANCTDSSEELICNSDLMNVLAFISLAGIAVGLLFTLTLGVWQVRKRRGVARTLMTAWGGVLSFPC